MHNDTSADKRAEAAGIATRLETILDMAMVERVSTPTLFVVRSTFNSAEVFTALRILIRAIDDYSETQTTDETRHMVAIIRDSVAKSLTKGFDEAVNG